MHIDSYKFGHIVIDGVPYDSDVIITSKGVHPHWWRQGGHDIALFDLVDRLDPTPRRLIIGTGAHGVCRVQKDVESFCRTEGIELIVIPTPEAVVEFNSLEDQSGTVTALHLTC